MSANMIDVPDIEDFMSDLVDNETTVSHLCERALGILALLEESCLPNNLLSTRCAIRMTMACAIEMARIADRSECSRAYLRARLTNIAEQFRTLSGEVSVLRAISFSSSSSTWGSIIEKSSRSLDAIAPSLAIVPLDEALLNSEVKLLNASFSAAVVEPTFNWTKEGTLPAEIQRSQSAIRRIDTKITAKKTAILQIDEAAAATLDDMAVEYSQRIIDPISLEDSPFRAERARRCGEINRSRGGKSRIINQHYTDIVMDNE